MTMAADQNESDGRHADGIFVTSQNRKGVNSLQSTLAQALNMYKMGFNLYYPRQTKVIL
jgi:hypothetical protein